MKHLKVKINGQIWKCYKLSNKTFNAKYSKAVAAITHYHHRKGIRSMYFNVGDFCKSTVTHEVVHAYLSYVDFSKMSLGAVEEKVCDLFGAKWHLISKVSDSIYKAFK